MVKYTKGPARENLDELDETTKQTKVQKLADSGTLIFDDRRLRSFYFDGRFLTAKDLTREQTYFLTRQADLSRACGTGVVAGLSLSLDTDGKSLWITAGHGITPGGEIVVLPVTLRVDIHNVAEIQRLDAAFGISPIPREAARNRSGLFVVALRPVEYSANPIASYPTSLGGARTEHDGDIIEALAVTLIPYPDHTGGAAWETRRARVAHEIFIRRGAYQVPVDALPLGMIALDHGIPQWIDHFLVRREVGSEQTDFLGFGFARRAVREAHLLQYQAHLYDILKAAGPSGWRFPASDHFFALPPAGRLPVQSIDAKEFSQIFFPPAVEVDLSVIPDDELGALLDESLLMNPIDLTQTAEQLDSTSILVLIPVARADMQDVVSQLKPPDGSGLIKLKSAMPSALPAKDALAALTLKWQPTPAAAPVVGLSDPAWAAVLGKTSIGDGLLWYARRKNLKYSAEIGEYDPLPKPPEPTPEDPPPQPEDPPPQPEDPPPEPEEMKVLWEKLTQYMFKAQLEKYYQEPLLKVEKSQIASQATLEKLLGLIEKYGNAVGASGMFGELFHIENLVKSFKIRVEGAFARYNNREVMTASYMLTDVNPPLSSGIAEISAAMAFSHVVPEFAYVVYTMSESAGKLADQVTAIVMEYGDPEKAGLVIHDFVQKLIASQGTKIPFAPFDGGATLKEPLGRLEPQPLPPLKPAEPQPLPPLQPAEPQPVQPAQPAVPGVDVKDLWQRVAASLSATNLSNQFESRRAEIENSGKVPPDDLSLLVKLLEGIHSGILRAGLIGEVFDPTDATDDAFTIEDFLAAIGMAGKRYRSREVVTGGKLLETATPALTTKSAAVVVALALSHRVAELAAVVAQNPTQANAATDQVLKTMKMAGAPEKAGLALRKLIETMIEGGIGGRIQ